MSAKLLLVYSCSGCFSAAQMANHLALKLDRNGVAEMSCIAGVGGGVSGQVRTAQSGRCILALDGCVLKCVSACLANAGVVADAHRVLSDYGVKKRQHADFNLVEAQRVYAAAVLPAAQALAAPAGNDGHGNATGSAPPPPRGRLATEGSPSGEGVAYCRGGRQ